MGHHFLKFVRLEKNKEQHRLIIISRQVTPSQITIDGLHLIYLPFEMAYLAYLDLDEH